MITIGGLTQSEYNQCVSDQKLICCRKCEVSKTYDKFTKRKRFHKKINEYKYHIEQICYNCVYKRKVEKYGLSKYTDANKNRVTHTLSGRASLLIYRCKQRAKRDGFNFDLSKELILEKLKIGKCEATNIQIELTEFDYNPYAPSIDRIDSTKGYTNDNIQLVCMIYNFCKNKFSTEQVNDFFNKLKNEK